MTTETIPTEEQVAEIWKASNNPFGDDFKLSHYFFAWNIVAAMLDSPEIQSLRNDAGRYRWLRAGGNDDIGVVRGFDGIDWLSTSVACTYEEGLDGEQLDEAIDDARRVEGEGE